MERDRLIDQRIFSYDHDDVEQINNTRHENIISCINLILAKQLMSQSILM